MRSLERTLLRSFYGLRRRLRAGENAPLELEEHNTPARGAGSGVGVRFALRGTAVLVVAAGIFAGGTWYGEQRFEDRLAADMSLSEDQMLQVMQMQAELQEHKRTDDRARDIAQLQRLISAAEYPLYLEDKHGIEAPEELEDLR